MGIAHVLEHTTLCGSERYPVRDPFFSILTRSHATFMNAMTSCAWTLYPFATSHVQDFSNLLDVYLDAVFFPLLREQDFEQEGHRLAPLDPTLDPWRAGSEVGPDGWAFQGVVYNEMKGTLSDANGVFLRGLLRAVHPTTCYGHNSGGDPARILDLSYAQLAGFHRRHYAPPNARFTFVGDLPVAPVLERISDRVLTPWLERSSSSSSSSSLPEEEGGGRGPWASRFRAPREDLIEPAWPRDGVTRTAEWSGPVTGSETSAGSQSIVALAVRTRPVTDVEHAVRMQVLGELLVGTSAAPLARALLERSPALGTAFAPGTGVDLDLSECLVVVGLQGVEQSRAGAVRDAVEAALRQIAEGDLTGLDADTVAGVLNQVEVGQRDRGLNWGVGLMQGVQPLWTVEAHEPFGALDPSGPIRRLREDYAANPLLFNAMVHEWLLPDSSAPAARIWLAQHADPGLAGRESARERARLTLELAGRDAAALAALAERAQTLQQAQAKGNATAAARTLLPSLVLADLSAEPPQYPGAIDPAVAVVSPKPASGGATTLFAHPEAVQPGMAYASLAFPFWSGAEVPSPDELPRAWLGLPAWQALVTSLGDGSASKDPPRAVRGNPTVLW